MLSLVYKDFHGLWNFHNIIQPSNFTPLIKMMHSCELAMLDFVNTSLEGNPPEHLTRFYARHMPDSTVLVSLDQHCELSLLQSRVIVDPKKVDLLLPSDWDSDTALNHLLQAVGGEDVKTEARPTAASSAAATASSGWQLVRNSKEENKKRRDSREKVTEQLRGIVEKCLDYATKHNAKQSSKSILDLGQFEDAADDSRLQLFIYMQYRAANDPHTKRILGQWTALAEPYPARSGELRRTQDHVIKTYGSVEIQTPKSNNHSVDVTRAYFQLPDLYSEWVKLGKSKQATRMVDVWLKDTQEDQLKSFAADLEDLAFMLQHHRTQSQAWYLKLPVVNAVFDKDTMDVLEWLSLLESLVLNMFLMFISSNTNDNMGMNDPIYEAPRFLNFLSETVIGRMIELLSYIHALNAFLVAANYFRLTGSYSVEYRVQLKKAEGYMLQFNMKYENTNNNNVFKKCFNRFIENLNNGLMQARSHGAVPPHMNIHPHRNPPPVRCFALDAGKF